MKSSGDGSGKIFAPPTDLVYSHKAGKGDPRFTGKYHAISDGVYTDRYTALIRERYSRLPKPYLELLQRDRIVLTCYCAAGDFGHRHLAVDILAKIAEAQGITIVRGGELEKPVGDDKTEAGQPQQLALFDLSAPAYYE